MVVIACVLGGVLWGGIGNVLNREGRFSFNPNIASLKGSPYGKVLALAMQGPIGLYFHKGESHETLEALGKPHVHEDGHVCFENHEEHQHAEKHESEKHVESEEPLHIRAKEQIKKMQAYAHRKTDGEALTPAHEHYLQSEIEDKLKLAYEMDPSNYTNYGNYHLFLVTSNYGKSDYDDDAGLALAKKTLEYCKSDKVDPQSWVTALSAAYNVSFYIGRYHEKFTFKQAEDSLREFDQCKQIYDELLEASQRNGLHIPKARFLEMKERVRYVVKLREAQGIYFNRIKGKFKKAD